MAWVGLKETAPPPPPPRPAPAPALPWAGATGAAGCWASAENAPSDPITARAANRESDGM